MFLDIFSCLTWKLFSLQLILLLDKNNVRHLLLSREKSYEIGGGTLNAETLKDSSQYIGTCFISLSTPKAILRASNRATLRGVTDIRALAVEMKSVLISMFMSETRQGE